MKFVVLDADSAHNKKIQIAFEKNDKIRLEFVGTVENLINVINGNQADEIKLKVQSQKLLDSQGLLQKSSEALEKLKGKKADDPEMVSVLKYRGELDKVILNLDKEVTELKKRILQPPDKTCHVVLVDRSFLGNANAKWMIDFRAQTQLKENKEVPIVILGYGEQNKIIQDILNLGFADYFVKPADILLLKHNLMKIAGGKIEQDGKIYELQTSAAIKIIKSSQISKMTEFEMTLEVNSSFEIGEIIELAVASFDGYQGGQILAKCTSCELDKESKTKGHKVGFSFVGLSPHTLNEIRRWMRSQYAEQKQKQS